MAISWTTIDDGKGRNLTDTATESNHVGTDADGKAIYETKEVPRSREIKTQDLVQTADLDGVKLLRVVNRQEHDGFVSENTVALIRLS